MMDESPKRFDRIVAILIQLQSKKIIKAHELADRFEVSLRTIYRDIRTLEASGVPIYSEAGVGYSLLEGYRLPRVMFTREEASSLIAAEKLMEKFTDKELRSHYTSAAFKLKAVLQSSDKDWVSTIESNVLMQPTGKLFNEKVPNTLAVLFKSIAEKTQIILLYQAIEADDTTERLIEPVGVFHENDNWYTLGFCHLRKDYRQFRADRIHQIKTTDKPFTLEHPDLETYMQKDQQKFSTTQVRIVVPKKISRYISSQKKHYGFVSQKEVEDGKVEMTFMSRDIEEGFPRWYMMFGDYGTILEPERLKERVLELLSKTRSRL